MAANPELQQLLAQSRDRVAYQNPLFQAVTQMAYQGLPTYARQGTQLSGTLSNQPPMVQPSGGGTNPLALAGAGGLGALLNGLGSGSGGNLGALVSALKRLFSRGGGGVQGDRPFGGGALTGPGFEPGSFSGWDPDVSDPFGNPYLPSDPGVFYGAGGGGAFVTDPSGGSGVGPGMQAYYQNPGSYGDPMYSSGGRP